MTDADFNAQLFCNDHLGAVARTSEQHAQPVDTAHRFSTARFEHHFLAEETESSSTGLRLGGVWLTLLMSNADPSCLACSVSYESPCYRSVLVTFWNCVARHGRLPQRLDVPDTGITQSDWLRQFCLAYEIGLVHTKRKQYSQRFLQTLQMTLDKQQKVWTLFGLQQAFNHHLDAADALTFCTAPYAQSAAAFGIRISEKRLDFDKRFLLDTLPTTATGQCKIMNSQLRIKGLTYSSSRLAQHEGRLVRVRYDPFTMSSAWCLLDGDWIELHARYENVLRRKTELDLETAVIWGHRRYGLVRGANLCEREIIVIVQSAESAASLLHARLRSNEERRLHGIERDAELLSDGNIESSRRGVVGGTTYF